MEYGMPFDFDSTAIDPEEYQYSAAEQRMFNMALFTNGVFPQVRIIQGSVLDPQIYVGQSLKVSNGSGLTVVISKGMAALEGVQYINTENKVLTLESGVAEKKFDIVIELDLVSQKVRAKAQLRGPGITVENSLIRTAYQYQILLATVTLPANTTSILPSYITDQRLNTTLCPIDDKPLCGLVSSSMQADTRIMGDQMNAMLQVNQDAFDVWFATMQATLDENVAANLLNLINGLQSTKADKSTTLEGYGITDGAKKVRIIHKTLLASAWPSSAPFTQVVSLPEYDSPTAKYAPWLFPTGTSDAVFAEAAMCGVKVTGDSVAGQLTFTASKAKPTIDIPIIIEMSDKYA